MHNDTTYLHKILSFDKGDIFYYIIIGTFLFYIWFESQISINYLLPFIILLMIIYYRQDYLHNIDLTIDHKLKKIVNNLLQNNYKYLQNHSEILYFLNDIEIYKKYNLNNFNNLLDILNKFYKVKKINELFLVLEVFNRFIYALPIELSKDFYININKLNKILYEHIKLDKLIKVEMQSYIPYNMIVEKYNYI